MGIATYKLKKSCGNFVKGGAVYLDLQDIAKILVDMPKGTSIQSIEQLPIVDLGIWFKISLDNDLFKDGAEIKDTSIYTRQIGFKDNSDSVYSYNSPSHWNLEEVVRKYEDIEKDEE